MVVSRERTVSHERLVEVNLDNWEDSAHNREKFVVDREDNLLDWEHLAVNQDSTAHCQEKLVVDREDNLADRENLGVNQEGAVPNQLLRRRKTVVC